MKVRVEIRCSCGNVIEKSYETTIGYIHDRFQCPRCKAIHDLKIVVTHVQATLAKDLRKLLTDFARWLRERKRITSVELYTRIVERKLLDPNYFPHTLSPLEYFIEFLREKDANLAEKLKQIMGV